MDKIDTSGLSQNRLNEARRQVGEDNVFLAKELIEYDPVLEPAMQHIFGGVLVGYFFRTHFKEKKKIFFAHKNESKE